jgi:hypothetical protein
LTASASLCLKSHIVRGFSLRKSEPAQAHRCWRLRQANLRMPVRARRLMDHAVDRGGWLSGLIGRVGGPTDFPRGGRASPGAG